MHRLRPNLSQKGPLMSDPAQAARRSVETNQPCRRRAAGPGQLRVGAPCSARVQSADSPCVFLPSTRDSYEMVPLNMLNWEGLCSEGGENEEGESGGTAGLLFFTPRSCSLLPAERPSVPTRLPREHRSDGHEGHPTRLTTRCPVLHEPQCSRERPGAGGNVAGNGKSERQAASCPAVAPRTWRSSIVHRPDLSRSSVR